MSLVCMHSNLQMINQGFIWPSNGNSLEVFVCEQRCFIKVEYVNYRERFIPAAAIVILLMPLCVSRDPLSKHTTTIIKQGFICSNNGISRAVFESGQSSLIKIGFTYY